MARSFLRSGQWSQTTTGVIHPDDRLTNEKVVLFLPQLIVVDWYQSRAGNFLDAILAVTTSSLNCFSRLSLLLATRGCIVSKTPTTKHSSDNFASSRSHQPSFHQNSPQNSMLPRCSVRVSSRTCDPKAHSRSFQV